MSETTNYKLIEAIRKNDTALITLIHSDSPVVLIQSKTLHLGIKFGTSSTILYLLQNFELDLNELDLQGNTPLHLASKSGRFDVVKLLLSKGANDMLINGDGLDAAKLGKTDEIKEFILKDRDKYIQKCSSLFNHFLSTSNRQNNLMFLSHFVDLKALGLQAEPKVSDLKDIQPDEQEPVYKGKNLNRSLLLDINFLHPYTKRTALHQATILGDPVLVDILLDCGASPFVRDKDGKSAIELCTDNGVKKKLESAELHVTLINPTSKQDSKGPYFSGYLYKWTNYKNGYQQRYFVLSEGILSYYKDSSTQSICKGSIELKKCSLIIDNKDQHKFELLLTDKPTPLISKQKSSSYISTLGRAAGAAASGLGVTSSKKDSSYHLKAKVLGEAKQWIVAITQTIHWLENQLRPSPAPNDTPTLTPMKDFNASRLTRNDSYDDTDGLDEFLLSLQVPLPSDNQVDLLKHRLDALNTIYTNLSTKIESESITINKTTINELIEINSQIQSSALELIANQNEQYQELVRDSNKWIRVLKDKNDIWMDTLHTMASEQADFIDEINRNQPISSLLEEKDESSEEEFFEMEETPLDFGISSNLPVRSENLVNDLLIGYPDYFRTSLDKEVIEPPTFSLWKLVKNAIGKDLTKLPLPVFFNEPLSMLQKNCEELEYSELLDYAFLQPQSIEKTIWVCAFALSSYASTLNRTKKPFNPMLGETFEFCHPQRKFWFIAEQVSHHPPISVSHTRAPGRWDLVIDLDVESKFWGKSLEIYPQGSSHLYLHTSSGDEKMHFSWKKVTTVVNGIILGTLNIDHYGDLIVQNHTTGDQVILTFHQPNWLGKDAHKLSGHAINSRGEKVYELEGSWDSHLTVKKLLHTTSMEEGMNKESVIEELKKLKYLKPNNKQQDFLMKQIHTDSVCIWKSHPYLKLTGSDKDMVRPFGLTPFSLGLNQLTQELRKCLPPTDSRFRPDQLAMEELRFDEANQLKLKLEQKQRIRRNEPGFATKPNWFTKNRRWCFDFDQYLKLRNKAALELQNVNDDDLHKERARIWNVVDVFGLD